MTTTVAAAGTTEIKRPKIDPEKVRVLGGRLLVMAIDSDEKTEGGIVVPESARKSIENRQTAPFLVVRMGPGRVTEQGNRIPIEGVQEGDFILMGKYAGTTITKDEKFRIINDVEILCVL